MVRVSERQKTIHTVSEWCDSIKAEEEDFRMQELMFEGRLVPSIGTMIFEHDVESAQLFDFLFNREDDLFNLLNIVEQLRYHEPRWKMHFKGSFNINDLLRDCPSEFKQAMRTSRVSFHVVLDLISNHPIFISDTHNPQPPVQKQLALTLERLGSAGNGSSVGRLARNYKLSAGAVVNCSRRCILAINECAGQYLQWPGVDRRKEISQVMSLEGFPGCVGFIDGTTFPIYQRPGVDGETFFDRKKRYSINAQVVCDCDRRITALYTGWPGSCHDNKCYQLMTLAQNPNKWFSDNEYLLADSAYRVSNNCVSTYKGAAAVLERNTEFNLYVAQARVRNEHAIGILKSRFGSLREMRLRLDEKDDMSPYLDWIRCCVLLHNMLAQLGDAWEEEFADEVGEMLDLPEVLMDVNVGLENDDVGYRRRELVRDFVVAYNALDL